ncbi:hypothetical protein AVEN_118855-1 [Araneus ventricosus]|uniref:ribonuclease H n=1 Tax=Araneus ventricosus TaxID=182803 RepID=A0A4Y2VKG4_ARAVE|nr:hypothetical protein AVEN_93074-1 [Araneus ventricosus]GBO24260.1 hypothetical protein AVEN_118855-1 [Araneus ventricosus]
MRIGKDLLAVFGITSGGFLVFLETKRTKDPQILELSQPSTSVGAFNNCHPVFSLHWSTHPSENLKPNQISFEDGEAYIVRKDIINIFTDGSKTDHGVGAAFCVLTNDIWAYQWSAKLNDNTVFQAELTALHEAVIYASHLPNHNTSKIHVDNRASIMASSNSKSTNEAARKILKILLSNPRIKVSWVKAHAGNIGNERADQLAKDATQHGQPYSHTKLPKPHIKGLIRKRMLEE